MQPGIELSLSDLVNKGFASIGERAVLCEREHFDAERRIMWFRLKGVVDDTAMMRTTWTSPDSAPQDGKRVPAMEAMASAITGQPAVTEINWLGVCRSCLDAVSGDRTKVVPKCKVQFTEGIPLPDFR